MPTKKEHTDIDNDIYREINSLSIDKIIWLQIKKGRISFSFEGLPDGVHFTISWDEDTGKVNFHVTKNIGDGSDKPKITIANIEIIVLKEIMTFVPTLLFNKIFRPISFNNYSRRSRKNIRLFYFDDLEQKKEIKIFIEKAKEVLNQTSKVERNKIKISKNLEKDFLPLINSSYARLLWKNNIKRLTNNSFDSKIKSFRGGILFIGKRKLIFLAINGKCYIATGKNRIHDLLAAFMTPELIAGLTTLINESIEKVNNSQTYLETKLFNNPYWLCIEKSI